MGTALKCLGAFVALCVATILAQRRPPNYSLEQMPVTAFDCRNKIIGGYYADPETDCQMFHVCVKVPGLGIQDFKFLCPNDTSFDQENQICDDWYNIDCEAATLYYSDNFDLYRIGSGLTSKVRTGSVNNAVTDVEDDLYLQQRNDRGENVGKDLLRGSHSGNFFSNRGGRDDDDEYSKDDLYKPKKKSSTPTKAPARKLLAGKRPVSQQTTPSTTTENYRTPAQRGFNSHQGRSFRGQNQRQETQSQPTTEHYRETEVYQRQRSNYYTPTTSRPYQPEQKETAATQRTEFFRTNFADSQKNNAVTQTSNFFNGNQNYNSQSTQKQQHYNGQNYNAQTTQKQNFNTQTTQNQKIYNKNNVNSPAPTTIRPGNGQNYFNNQPAQEQNNYNNQGTTYRPNYNFVTGSTAAPNYNAQSTRNYQQPSTQKPSFYNNFNVPTTQAPAASTYNPQTTRGQFSQNYNTNGQARTQNYNPSTANYNPSTTPDYNNNYDSSDNTERTNQYATQKLYKINLGAAIGGFQNNNADKYDESKDEFLKTAPSQNLAQSNFNRVQNNYKAFTTAVSSAYNFATTAKPFQQQQTTVNAVQRGKVIFAATADVTEKPRPFTNPAPPPPALKKKEQDQAYDYAYYDDGTASEYENLENVEEFSRTTSRKRSTK